MARLYEIESAFRAAIIIEPSGRRVVTTQRFVEQLARVNWDYSLREANRWIETYVTTFKDITPDESENRLFFLFNPNGGL